MLIILGKVESRKGTGHNIFNYIDCQWLGLPSEEIFRQADSNYQCP